MYVFSSKHVLLWEGKSTSPFIAMSMFTFVDKLNKCVLFSKFLYDEAKQIVYIHFHTNKWMKLRHCICPFFTPFATLVSAVLNALIIISGVGLDWLCPCDWWWGLSDGPLECITVAQLLIVLRVGVGGLISAIIMSHTHVFMSFDDGDYQMAPWNVSRLPSY